MLVLSAALFTNCDSAAEKVDSAKVDVQDANKNLKEAQQNAAKEAEWQTFKTETLVKIKDNETRIADLKAKLKQSGQKFDAAYAKKIDELEAKNIALQQKLGVYEKSQSDWEAFKREFNHDMDEIGRAFQDLAVDNKK